VAYALLPLVVGLTGGIGSGKSSVAECFKTRGATIIDADAVSHQLSQPGQTGALAVADTFGENLLDAEGAIDRAALRARVFADPAARKQLEGILHPLIRAEMQAQLQAAPPDCYVIWMVPLLIESNRPREVCARIAVVDCSEAQQIERVRARSGLTEEAVRAIMAAQVSRQKRLEAADEIIDNSQDFDHIAPQVFRLHCFYTQLHLQRTA
jgi:dephospho-CoA kinase